MTKVTSFSTSQEEADTRMFLHSQYALNTLQGNIVINSPDTDVFISLMVSEKIIANINFKTSTKNKARIISFNKDKESLKDKYDAVVSAGLACFTKALLSLHEFMGCAVPLLVQGNQRDLKQWKKKNVDYIKLFESLGEDWNLEEGIIKYIKGFVCLLYGYSDMKDVNMLQYKLLCEEKGDCCCVKLLSCRSS